MRARVSLHIEENKKLNRKSGPPRFKGHVCVRLLKVVTTRYVVMAVSEQNRNYSLLTERKRRSLLSGVSFIEQTIMLP